MISNVGTGFKMLYRSLILVGFLMSVTQVDQVGGRSVSVLGTAPNEGVVSSDRISLIDTTDGIPLNEGQHHVGLEKRGDVILWTSLQPFYILANTVYGGYSSQPLQLTNKAKGITSTTSIGSLDFYQQNLDSYLRNGYTPASGIYGFAAHFNTHQASSDYTFFKSVSTDKSSVSAKQSSPHQSRAVSVSGSENFLGRRDDQVQCRNQNGSSALFSQGECASAAAKMANEKTSMSECGGCKLIMIGPEGQLSSSNMPTSDLQTHASMILSGCQSGQRVDSSNSIKSYFSNSISKSAKPNYVLLLSRGSGAVC